MRFVLWLSQETFFLLVLLGNNDAGMAQIKANIRGRSNNNCIQNRQPFSFVLKSRKQFPYMCRAVCPSLHCIATETFRKKFILRYAKFNFFLHKNLFFEPLSTHFHPDYISLKSFFLNMLFILVVTLNILEYRNYLFQNILCYYYCGVVLCTS